MVTPVLSRYATTDPHIESFVTDSAASETTAADLRYLHTSPEFPMKRLLCAGAGDIYQICSVFRREEGGRIHNPEFQLLEWYRSDFDHHQLMHDVEALVQACWQALPCQVDSCPDFARVSYYEAVHAATGLHREQLTPENLQTCIQQQGIDCPLQTEGPLADSLDTWLDFLMSMVVAPGFDNQENQPGGPNFIFLYDYPASQASLARLLPESGNTLAARFELFYGSKELANGFYELENAAEQRKRFEQDIELRRQQGLASVPMDEELLNALNHGLPDCAGVAMGLDRLLMVLSGAETIDSVMAFPDDRA